MHGNFGIAAGKTTSDLGEDHERQYLWNAKDLRATTRLVRYEESLGFIFDNLPRTLTLTELDTGRFVEVNQAYLRHVGAESPEQVLGKTSIELGVMTPIKAE